MYDNSNAISAIRKHCETLGLTCKLNNASPPSLTFYGHQGHLVLWVRSDDDITYLEHYGSIIKAHDIMGVEDLLGDDQLWQRLAIEYNVPIAAVETANYHFPNPMQPSDLVDSVLAVIDRQLDAERTEATAEDTGGGEAYMTGRVDGIDTGRFLVEWLLGAQAKGLGVTTDDFLAKYAEFQSALNAVAVPVDLSLTIPRGGYRCGELHVVGSHGTGIKTDTIWPVYDDKGEEALHPAILAMQGTATDGWDGEYYDYLTKLLTAVLPLGAWECKALREGGLVVGVRCLNRRTGSLTTIHHGKPWDGYGVHLVIKAEQLGFMLEVTYRATEEAEILPRIGKTWRSVVRMQLGIYPRRGIPGTIITRCPVHGESTEPCNDMGSPSVLTCTECGAELERKAPVLDLLEL